MPHGGGAEELHRADLSIGIAGCDLGCGAAPALCARPSWGASVVPRKARIASDRRNLPEWRPDAFIGNIVPADAFDAVLFVEETTAARKNAGR